MKSPNFVHRCNFGDMDAVVADINAVTWHQLLKVLLRIIA